MIYCELCVTYIASHVKTSDCLFSRFPFFAKKKEIRLSLESVCEIDQELSQTRQALAKVTLIEHLNILKIHESQGSGQESTSARLCNSRLLVNSHRLFSSHSSTMLIICLIKGKCLNAEWNSCIFVTSQTEDLKVVKGGIVPLCTLPVKKLNSFIPCNFALWLDD